MRDLRLIRLDLPKDLSTLCRKGLNYEGIAHSDIAADKMITVHPAIWCI